MAGGARLFIGVDGGGTRTRARVRDEAGTLVGEGMAGPGNAHLGMVAFAEVMRACRTALAVGGIAETELGRRVHAGFGLAGTQPAADHAAVLAWPHPFASLAVDTDAYIAYLGAFRGEDGAILILGTGSCGLAVLGGRRLTIGGWGAEVGDQGSGMAIGKRAVRHSLLALEGMAPLTPLAEEVLAQFGRKPDNMVAWATTAIPGDYAKFAPLVFAHAGEGDGLAIGIVNQTARDATVLIDRLVALGATRIAMIGGVFPPLVPWLPDRVRPVLVAPAGDAMDGAILMARREAGAGAAQSSS